MHDLWMHTDRRRKGKEGVLLCYQLSSGKRAFSSHRHRRTVDTFTVLGWDVGSWWWCWCFSDCPSNNYKKEQIVYYNGKMHFHSTPSLFMVFLRQCTYHHIAPPRKIPQPSIRSFFAYKTCTSFRSGWQTHRSSVQLGNTKCREGVENCSIAKLDDEL